MRIPGLRRDFTHATLAAILVSIVGVILLALLGAFLVHWLGIVLRHVINGG